MNKYKIGLFKDKDDLAIILTNEEIVNITGMMGAGKTTLACKIKNQEDKELISLDWMFGYSIANRPEY